VSSIFLSYSSADVDDAVRIKAALEARDFLAVFRDKDPDQGIPPGTLWLSELFANIDRAEVVVFFASERSLTSAWCQTELAYAVARGKFVVQVARTAVAVHPLLRDRQAIGPIDDVTALVEALVTGLKQTGHLSDDPFTWDPNKSPYPGLRRFTEDEAAVLFGRDAERTQVLDRLARPLLRSILVVGPSGSGKSSFIRAGVLRRLRRQKGMTPVRVDEPGVDPWGRVAAALEAEDPRINAASLIEGTSTFAMAVDRIVARDSGRIVLFIDQAEDLVSRASPEQVVDLAERLGSIDRDRLALIFALRSASLEAWLRDPVLGALTPGDPILVQPLDRNGLRDVIVKPANLAGIRFEPPELVDTIVEDTGDGRALPLLAALLEELTRGHTRQHPAVVTPERYNEVGGVAGIIKHRAAAATDWIREELRLGEDAAVNAYLRLVDVDDEGQAIRTEVAVDELPKGEVDILSAFVRERLVTRDRRIAVGVSGSNRNKVTQ
jgi:TIR domain